MDIERVHDARHDHHHGQERECFVCDGGYVYIGYLVPTPDGDEQEVIEPYPCKRCSEAREEDDGRGSKGASG